MMIEEMLSEETMTIETLSKETMTIETRETLRRRRLNHVLSL